MLEKVAVKTICILRIAVGVRVSWTSAIHIMLGVVSRMWPKPVSPLQHFQEDKPCPRNSQARSLLYVGRDKGQTKEDFKFPCYVLLTETLSVCQRRQIVPVSGLGIYSLGCQ